MVRLSVLSEELAVDVEDLRILASGIGADEPEPGKVTTETACELRDILSPHCERTVLALWWPGAENQPYLAP